MLWYWYIFTHKNKQALGMLQGELTSKKKKCLKWWKWYRNNKRRERERHRVVLCNLFWEKVLFVIKSSDHLAYLTERLYPLFIHICKFNKSWNDFSNILCYFCLQCTCQLKNMQQTDYSMFKRIYPIEFANFYCRGLRRKWKMKIICVKEKKL